ncbi:hypothetical protein A8144_10385 [Mycobacterium leprae 3125609]|nr:hypothetical protein A8144_10385 [Mycobacterium leprae 3125609]OAX70772.1 hypothetical protein A3216_10045 [Mycobacterium leprae 7935681]
MSPDQQFGRGDSVIYWQVPKGGTLNSTIVKMMGNPRYKSLTTIRNLRIRANMLRGQARLGARRPPWWHRLEPTDQSTAERNHS